MGEQRPGSSQLGLLERVLHVTQQVVDRIAPGDLVRPTPCADYDVRRLLEHLIGWQLVFAACAADREPAFADGSPTYTASAELTEDFRSASTALIENLGGRRDHAITLPYRGDTTVELLVDELLAETVLHTWDLATALDTTVAFDDETVAAAHIGLSKLLRESFAESAFRAVQGPVAGRSEFERLLARSGRSAVRT